MAGGRPKTERKCAALVGDVGRRGTGERRRYAGDAKAGGRPKTPEERGAGGKTRTKRLEEDQRRRKKADRETEGRVE